MDTGEPEESNVTICRGILKVIARHGYDMTLTVAKVLRNNPHANKDLFFGNLRTILEREEKKIKSDLENGILDVNRPQIANQRRKRANQRAMNHTKAGWISKVYYDARDKEAKRKLEQLSSRKAQTSTPKKKGACRLDDTINITSPEKTPKSGEKEDNPRRKQARDEIDTDYSTNDNVVPSEVEDEAKVIIHRKNKKIRRIKRLQKGEEARIKDLKTRIKDFQGKKKTMEDLEKSLADQEADQHQRERELAKKETEMENKSMEIEREKDNMAKKIEAVKQAVLKEIPPGWMTRDGKTLKAALEASIHSIIESEDEGTESGANTMESGTGLTGDTDTMDIDIPEDLQDLRTEDLNLHLLDEKEDEEDARQHSPDGQVIKRLINPIFYLTKTLIGRSRPGEHPRDQRGQPGGGAEEGRRPGHKHLGDQRQFKEPVQLCKTDIFLANYVQSLGK